MLRAMPAGLPACRQYINFKLVPKENGNGFDKKPLNAAGYDHDPHDATQWRDATTAWSSRLNTDGIGFVLTPGYIGIDLDKCRTSDGWTPLAMEMWNAFPGAYADITPSGKGIRLIFRGTLPDGHKCKVEGVEVYTLRRFLTITGNGARGNADWNASPELCAWLMNRLKLHQEALPPITDVDPDPGRLAKDLTDDELITVMVSQASSNAAVLMDGKATMSQKWNMDDHDALARSFPAETDRSDGLPFEYHRLDMSVMSDLAYWTGHDVARMERLFQRWPGYREWKHEGRRGYHILRCLHRALNNKTFWGEKQSITVGVPAEEASGAPAQPGHFLAFLPDHTYYHRPTGAFWPASSVDDLIGKVEVVGLADNAGSVVKVKATKWLAMKQAIHQRTWFPGGAEIIEDCVYRDGVWTEHKGNRLLNTYRAPLAPQIGNGDVKPWLDHLQFMYPRHVDVILDWMAHVAQKPSVKVNWALVWGGSQGIGKDSMLEPLLRAVGEWNWRETTPETILTSQFNEYLVSRVLRINEAKDTGNESRFQFYDKTKTIIAAPPNVHTVNAKNQRPMQVQNLNAVIITTNYRTGGLYLPIDDRRHYVMFSDVVRSIFNEAYWTAYHAWKDAGGLERCAAFLMARDVSRFNPKAPPFQTPEFFEMVEGGQHAESGELIDIIASMNGVPFSIDQLATKALLDFNNHDLKCWLLETKNRTRVARALEDAGAVKHRNPDDKAKGRWFINKKPTYLYRVVG